ncbi:hypothetical protein G6F59_016583 [Rhizopus arrhizus]|nr:hypothetical protein G6F59_016583 [Rhizopus arrhizus]
MSDSLICLPAGITGFKEVMGSWKIIEIWLPRMARMDFSGRASRSRPSNSMRPPATRPGARSRRMMDSDVTLLPQPDSPTRPSVSPRRRSNESLSTATTGGSSPSKQVVRSCTRKTGVGCMGAPTAFWPDGDRACRAARRPPG